MDLSMVSGMLAAQAGNVQMQVAATIIKSNADAEKSAVLTLLGAAQQSASPLANVAAGIGGNLDVTA
jgi:peptidyl-tRNA hydrolase